MFKEIKELSEKLDQLKDNMNVKIEEIIKVLQNSISSKDAYEYPEHSNYFSVNDVNINYVQGHITIQYKKDSVEPDDLVLYNNVLKEIGFKLTKVRNRSNDDYFIFTIIELEE